MTTLETDTPAGLAVGGGLQMPMPQEFATVEDERLHRKVTLAAAFRMFSKAGLDEGVAGHVTARDPEFTDSYWVNPFGMHFSLIKQSDLVRVNHAGEVVEGNRAVNGAAVAIHCGVHAARPDVIAAAHAHGPYGKTLSSLPMGAKYARKMKPMASTRKSFLGVAAFAIAASIAKRHGPPGCAILFPRGF